MSPRTRFRRPLLWSAAVLLLSAAPAAAQPPSPLELARGLREHGYTELAMEYLKELETKPLSPDDKAALGLEKAKALLDASEEEPDEGTRVGMVSVAKEGLNAFLLNAPNHPRKVEGLLATAKLISLDAREQLNRARRIDIPPAGEDDVARDAAQEKQKAEAKKARPLFLLSSKRYAEASELLRTKLGEAADANAKKALEREVLEADLAAGINQFNTAETFMPVTRQTIAEQEERNKYLEASKEMFGKLDKGGSSNRTVWVARAWIAEVTYEQNDFNNAAQLVKAIADARVVEADEGKRLARFFQLRRDFLAAVGSGDPKKVTESERALFAWLQQYGNPRRPTNEVYAVRFYRARALHLLAESTVPRPKEPNPKDPPPKVPPPPPPPPTIGATARAQFAEAERLYRGLSQTDHDYTGRATKYRMQVVRRLLGDADQPLSTYDTFEKAQMASLIQLSKLSAEEGKKDAADPAKVDAVRTAAILLLERARELHTPADNQADVADVLLRLIYFYQLSGQPYKAAVLGEHVARTMPKMSGGKAAVAGLLGLNGYRMAGAKLKIDPTATDEEQAAVVELRKVDRQKAMALARFLDEKYPNDNATDSARFQLALMLNEDRLHQQAFDAVLKIRPAYPLINEVRLLEGYLAAQLIAKDSPLEPAQKVEVFNRAKVDLAKAARPATVALEAEVRAYVSARCRLATLMLSQGRVDAKAEEADPGYRQAMAIAGEVLAAVPTFECLFTDKKLNLDGMELTLLAQDVRARALFLQSKALIDAGKVDEAGVALEPALAEIDKTGSAVTEEMKKWAADTEASEADALQRDKILRLAAGVDKVRIEVLMAGFRLRVAQGRAENDSEIMIALIGRVGGTIEDNLPVLEALGRETAAKMVAAKKAGKENEAKQLGFGLAILLKKIQNVPKLSAQQLLFIGQMLSAVGQYDAAVEALKRVPEPEFKDWKSSPPDRMKSRFNELKKQIADIENPIIAKLPPEDQAKANDPDGRKEVLKKVVAMLMGPQKKAYDDAQREFVELEKKMAALPQGFEAKYGSQIAFYAPAQLSIAKTLREDKRFQASEALLNEIIGTPDKPGWGSNRLYFRKELATLYEERAATVADPKVAGPEWGRALQVWQSLFAIARTRLQKLPPVPKLADNPTEEQKADHKAKEDARKVEERRLKNDFADAFFEQVRCTVKANQQLRAGPALAPKLQKSLEDAAKNCIDIEKQLPKIEDWDAEVQNRYVALLAETPAMLAEYKKLGGKIFLEKKPLDP